MKCKICERDTINKEDDDYIYKSNRYIHISCYRDSMIQKGYNIESIEKEISENLDKLKPIKQESLERRLFFSEIYSNYEISVFPTFFFTKIGQIVNGSFKGMRSGISYFELKEMFVLMRKYLDNMYAKNNSKGNYFKTELDRLNYDLAIIINNYDKYKKHKTETSNIKVSINEIEQNTAKDIEMKINTKKNNSSNKSIANIVDEFF